MLRWTEASVKLLFLSHWRSNFCWSNFDWVVTSGKETGKMFNYVVSQLFMNFFRSQCDAFVRSFNMLQLVREVPFKWVHHSNKSKYITTKEAKSFPPTLDFYFPIIFPNSKVCVHLDLKVFFLIWEDSCMLWDIWVDCSSISLCITVLVSIVTLLLAK